MDKLYVYARSFSTYRVRVRRPAAKRRWRYELEPGPPLRGQGRFRLGAPSRGARRAIVGIYPRTGAYISRLHRDI